ncbi:YutD family protein [Companilactobacillus ginsenosidimutans]|uniref:Transcriptional regulator n=1 Tax=Companilactobacillus ginsenosidimutans TaxID=1007676 RepID=A0A0H4QJQ1_9LACO|nr:YutD family protein [Companilactobacillus ginsenosidimutans]AKP66898.1 hypothetical protein ABM34_04720 [Companilactobacillus ginsenosidimutans]
MEETEAKVTKQADVIMLEDDLVVINDTKYKLIENHDGGFDKDKIEERYNNVLDKYDYIVGDWGYDQLRFKGFFIDKRIESNLDNKISHLEDYLIEYCNFGCAYFILERVDKLPMTKPKRHHQQPKTARNNQHSNNSNGKNHRPTNNHANSHKKNNHGKKDEKAKPHIRKRKTETAKTTNKSTNNRKPRNPRAKSNSTKSGARTFKIRKIDK